MKLTQSEMVDIFNRMRPESVNHLFTAEQIESLADSQPDGYTKALAFMRAKQQAVKQL